MTALSEGNLTFTFPNGWVSERLDNWSFYRKQFQSTCGGCKAVDFLAINDCTWFIEVKDYRSSRRTKPSNLADEVAEKVRDSLAIIAAASANANVAKQKQVAWEALTKRKFKVVLHLEQPRKPSKLTPRAIDPADVKQRMRQLLRAIDPHPEVHEVGNPANAGWMVR